MNAHEIVAHTMAVQVEVVFRNPMDLSALGQLTGFAEEFGQRASARATPYRTDVAPG